MEFGTSCRSMRAKSLKKVTFAEHVSYDDNTQGALKSLNPPEKKEDLPCLKSNSLCSYRILFVAIIPHNFFSYQRINYYDQFSCYSY